GMLLDAERPRTAQGRSAQRIVRGQGLRVAGDRLREQRGGPHFLEEIQAVVARRAVGAETEVGARAAQRLDRREAARELQVRRRTVRDRRGVAAEKIDLLPLE